LSDYEVTLAVKWYFGLAWNG